MSSTEQTIVPETNFDTMVVRSTINPKKYFFEEVERSLDADIRQLGKHGLFQCEHAQLRMYSNDPDFFGDEDYQEGNGIRLATEKDIAYYGESYRGLVIDCDGDVAYKRATMLVVSTNIFGRGHIQLTGWVSWNEEDQEYNGYGMDDDNKGRWERWDVFPRKDLVEDE